MSRYSYHARAAVAGAAAISVAGERRSDARLARVRELCLSDSDDAATARRLAPVLRQIKSRINEKLTCEGHTMLALCVIRKKIECLGCALREGADPWMPAGSLGWTALHFAAACGAEHCAKVLADAMRNKQDQRQGQLQDEEGMTPAHLAAMTGHAQILDILAHRGHNLCAADNRGATPLHLAAQEGHFFAVVRLIMRKSDLDAKDVSGSTPLSLCASQGHANVAAKLCESGCSVVVNGPGNPLHLAVVNNKASLVKLLLKAGAGCSINAETLLSALEFGSNLLDPLLEAVQTQEWSTEETLAVLRSPLLKAISSNDARSVGAILGAGCPVDTRASATDTRSALHVAASQPCGLAVVQVLVEAGADIELLTRDKRTPLHFAVAEGVMSTAALLLERRPKLGVRADAKGNTALHLAAAQNDAAMVEMLLSKGTLAAVGEQNQRGGTALHLASSLGHLQAVLVLLRCAKQRLYINVTNAEGDTPLLCACKAAHFQVAHALLQAGADTGHLNAASESALLFACAAGACSLVTSLLDSKATAYVCKANGDSPLSLAARNGHLSVVTRLLAASRFRKAVVESFFVPSKRTGNAPLHFAASAGESEICALLVDRSPTGGEICDLRNSAGETPLHLACSNDCTEAAEELLVRGANPDSPSNNGVTPRDIAERGRKQELLDLMAEFACIKRAPPPHAMTAGQTAPSLSVRLRQWMPCLS